MNESMKSTELLGESKREQKQMNPTVVPISDVSQLKSVREENN